MTAPHRGFLRELVIRAAYDPLPAATKERLAGLVGLHGRASGAAGEKLYGADKGATQKEYSELARPAVINHPLTGRPIVNPMRTHAVVGMSREEAWPLIEEVAGRSTRAQRLLPLLARR